MKLKVSAYSLQDTNPKTRFGQAKPPLHLLPTPALLHMAEALRDGSVKYGALNWRTDPVSASTYYSACLRHLTQWWDGEDIDPVSLVHHLGHAATNIAILLDALESQMLLDDRPPKGPTGDLIRKFTKPLPAATEKAAPDARRSRPKQSRLKDAARCSAGDGSGPKGSRGKTLRPGKRGRSNTPINRPSPHRASPRKVRTKRVPSARS